MVPSVAELVEFFTPPRITLPFQTVRRLMPVSSAPSMVTSWMVTFRQGHKRENIFLTVLQVSDLAGAIGAHYADLVWFLATTGLRFGEAAELRGRDVNLARGRVKVFRSVTDAPAGWSSARPRMAPPGMCR
jgi:integrase